MASKTAQIFHELSSELVGAVLLGIWEHNSALAFELNFGSCGYMISPKSSSQPKHEARQMTADMSIKWKVDFKKFLRKDPLQV